MVSKREMKVTFRYNMRKFLVTIEILAIATKKVEAWERDFVSFLGENGRHKRVGCTDTYILGRNFEGDFREVLRELDTQILPHYLSGIQEEINTNYYTEK